MLAIIYRMSIDTKNEIQIVQLTPDTHTDTDQLMNGLHEGVYIDPDNLPSQGLQRPDTSAAAEFERAIEAIAVNPNDAENLTIQKHQELDAQELLDSKVFITGREPGIGKTALVALDELDEVNIDNVSEAAFNDGKADLLTRPSSDKPKRDRSHGPR